MKFVKFTLCQVFLFLFAFGANIDFIKFNVDYVRGLNTPIIPTDVSNEFLLHLAIDIHSTVF